MSTYRRILALVALHADAGAVAARALQLSRCHNATLAIAAVIDYHPGFECDHVPFLSPEQMQDAMRHDVAERLDELMSGLGSGAEVIVASGRETEATNDILRSWRPDLVLVGARAPHGLDAGAAPRRASYDVLIVRDERARMNSIGRLVNALSAAF